MRVTLIVDSEIQISNAEMERKGALVAAKRPIMNCVNVQHLFNSIHSLEISFSLFTWFLKKMTHPRRLLLLQLLLLFATSSSFGA
jgi:hypothetical protein